jgi:hypothetical protein
MESPPVDSMFFDGHAPLENVVNVSNKKTYINDGFMRTRKPHLGNDVVGILIGVENYHYNEEEGGVHRNHAISAVKYGNTLFAFDPWGKRSKSIDRKIFKNIQGRYSCTKLYMYTGKNLQEGNYLGVCVGYASNFILEMFIKIYQNAIPKSKITQDEYNNFVYTVLTTRGVCFGSSCVKNMSPGTFRARIHRNFLPNSNSPKNKISNLERINFSRRNNKPARPKTAKGPTGTVSPPKNTISQQNNKPSSSVSTPKKAKSPTVAELRKIAQMHGMKGHSKHTKKANLAKFIANYTAKVS